MADLSNVGLDSNVEEAGEGFDLLPAGEYSVVITSDEVRDNKKGTGKLLVLKHKVVSGRNTGVDITNYITLTNPNQQAASIGQGTLKKICSLTNVQFPPSDTSMLHGKKMNIKVVVDSFTSNTTGDKLQSNKIKSYREYREIPDDAYVTQEAVQHPTHQSKQSGW